MIDFLPSGDSLEIRVLLPAPCSRVYRAWTAESEFAQWFRGSEGGYLEIHEFDCRQDGGFDLTMVNPIGEQNRLAGTYIRVESDRFLAFTWHWKTEIGFSEPMEVSVEFEPVGETTLLTIRHRPFASDFARDAHRNGWEPCLLNLRGYLS
jgi:uncharacterized protein YndB with AHSA1/START domain